MPALMPEWAYGHWKSRDVYEHQDDVEDDWRGYRDNDLPLDAIVIDSPWETQYNTWRFNPHQFPDAPGLVARDARGRGPHRRLGDALGQPRVDRRPAAARRRSRSGCTASRRRTTRRAPSRATSSATPTASRTSGAGGWAPARSSTSPPTEAREWWRELARRVFELGVEGVKADDGEGYYFPPDSPLRRRAQRRRGGLGVRAPLPRATQEALDEVHGPGSGVVFGRSGWTGQQATGMLWGGDQASRLLVAAGAARLAADLRRQRLLEPLPRRRRLPRPPAGRALRARAAGPLGAARGALAADAGPRPLPAGGLDLRRRGPRPLPRGGAAARAAGPLHPARPPPPPRAPGCRSCARSAWSTPTIPRAGRSPTPTSSARRSGSPRCWRRARISAAPTCPAASGSAGGPASGSRAGDWIDAEAPLGADPALGPLGLDRRHLPGGRTSRAGLGEEDPRAAARGDAVGRAAARAARSRGSRTGPASAGERASGR